LRKYCAESVIMVSSARLTAGMGNGQWAIGYGKRREDATGGKQSGLLPLLHALQALVEVVEPVGGGFCHLLVLVLSKRHE